MLDFLASAAEAIGPSSQDLGAVMAIFVVLLIICLVLWIGIYIYTSLAYMAIARKAKQDSPGLAWVPAIGPAIIAYKSAKMHWWPWLLIIFFPIFIFLAIPFMIYSSTATILFGVLLLMLGFACGITFSVFFFIWHWKLYEAVGKPGWWILLTLIPYAGAVIYLVFIGIAAWGK